MLVAAAGLLLLSGGCGEQGVAEDAVLTAYVTAPLCAGARHELTRDGGRAGEIRVRLTCLSSPLRPGGLSLAAAGANAREATEDSTAIVYVEAANSAAARFSHPILESAGIPWLSSSSGATAVRRVLKAVGEAGGASSLRDSVGKAVQ